MVDESGVPVSAGPSLGAVLRESCRKWADKPAMLAPTGKSFEPISYRQLADRVRAYAGALQSLGLEPGDRLAIQSENCVEWAFTDWACQTLGVIVVPIYSTLPADQTQYIVRDSGAQVVVAGSPDQAAKSNGMDEVRVVLLKGDPESLDARAVGNPDALSVEEWNRAIDAVDPESIATFIYTSGTTGNPKGAMLPHRALTWICGQVVANFPFDHNDTFLSFLPMSHVYERVNGQVLPIFAGATIGYAKSLASLANDMIAVKPTIMLCVPRFLEATRERVLENVAKAPPIRQKLFALCLEQGLKKAKGQFAPLAGLLDKIVASKVRARTGGRIRFFVSGGAALPPHVAEFYMALGLKVLQGYGLTETSSGCSINPPDDSKYWTVGVPIGETQIKLADDGEILIKSPAVMTGYYNLPEETAQAIDADGWFHSGDIGEYEGRHIKITDRKKDILVLANGKNVAPQMIENRMKESDLIQEVVLFGDGSEYVYGLIVPNLERVRTALAGDGIQLADDAELVRHPATEKLIKAEVSRINKTLANFEMVKRYALIATPFTVEGGELTPTLKVKRKFVLEKYAHVLETLRG
ncbi:MAG: long-chain fatty acid--CoA ligase [Fimbriimonadaceae bacterium]